MDHHIRLLTWISLILLIASSATSFPQSDSLSELLLSRRTTQEECYSYSRLQDILRRDAMELTSNTASQLFRRNGITQDQFRSAASAMCIDLLPLNQYRNTLERCPDADVVLAHMDVFSGLCYANGTITAFLRELIDGFVASNFAWRNECFRQVAPIIAFCGRPQLDQPIDMERGPQAYKNLMIQQGQCFTEQISKNDVSVCGDEESIRRLAVFVYLMTSTGPGVTFSLSDFGL